MKTLLLIDAYAMIYRAYYAFIRAPRMNSRGENTSAIFGFVVTMEDLLKKIKPSHFGVAFDPAGKTFRHEAFDLYKAQREETPEDIRKAVPIIKEILTAMNIPILEVPGYEADDVIGTLAKKGAAAGFEVFMATPDKDYGQLVEEHISMYRPRHTGGFEQMGPKEVCEKYGLTNQLQVIDLLGLMGDASDNIPGCKGVGEKTAVALLQQFGSIENLIASTGQLKGALKEKIETQVEQIKFSKFLATIRTDVPIELDEEALRAESPNVQAITDIYTRLEFNSLLKKYAPQESTKPATKKQSLKQNEQSALQLDLFGDGVEETITANTSSSPEQPVHDSEDDVQLRLCQYLLNPEVAYNPMQPPSMKALKADAALYRLYTDVELPLVPVLHDMEKAGVRIDVAKLHEAELSLTKELKNLEQEIYSLVGTNEFNINSPKQVGELLFDSLHLDSKAKRSKNGAYSTSEEILLGIKDKHPVVAKILDYRELKKLISTYIAPLPSYINPTTGKIHTTYNQTVTATGRLSSSNPNLQNLPIRSERGKFIREAVIPDEGCVFLSADYSQIELRLMAHLSQDPHLIEAFKKGQDIHAATAAKIFGVPIEMVSKDQRRKAKTANFGIIYGISAFGLAQQLDCPRAEAKALIDGYFEAFPGVIAYIEHQKELARQRGYTLTVFGRKRYLPDINSHNATVRSFAERNAVNAPIQGTAADLIKMAMVAIHRRLEEEGLHAQMIMQVHDELNFNVPQDEIEQVREIVVKEMENAGRNFPIADMDHPLPIQESIPLLASCDVGANWLAAH